MAMIPERNNVYGTITAPEGLVLVLASARSLGCWESAEVRTSGYNGQQTIRLASSSAEFDTEPAGESEHLMNGAVAGTLDEVIAFVRRLSRVLRDSRIDHHFEVYAADDTLAAEIPPE